MKFSNTIKSVATYALMTLATASFHHVALQDQAALLEIIPSDHAGHAR